jgi:thioredoxin-like negative regulator of GroEL
MYVTDERQLTLDDLLGPIPEGMVIRTEDDVAPRPYLLKNHSRDGNMSDVTSKVQRVRDYLKANPDVKNKDIAKALSEYGVTASDVANAKTRLKKEKGSRRSQAKQAEASSLSAAPVAKPDPEGQVTVKDLNAGIAFVREIGSLDRAKQLLVLLEQINKL